MSGLCFGLRSTNSSQSVMLYCDKQKDGAITFTLTGKYEGKEIQIDFDEFSADEAKDLAAYINSRASA